MRLFVRERSQLSLQAALIVGLPCLVVVFALRGLPSIRNLSLDGDLNVVEQLRESVGYLVQAFDVGGLVSGLLLFQIILLALMGSNNGALEIAGERMLFEREKLAGQLPRLQGALPRRTCYGDGGVDGNLRPCGVPVPG